MNYDEYIFIASEITELESLLAEIPKENVIERMGLESRLQSAKNDIADFIPEMLPRKARLTFRGRPVFGSYGIAADFASKAAGFFTDAFAAIVAENLCYMGRIPDKQKNQLLITGTALGSFGFEFELPSPEKPEDPSQGSLFSDPNRAEDAMQKLEALFNVTAIGSDDDVAELVDQIHPRAVKKAAEFLNYLSEQDAWCGLEFKESIFKFEGIEQIRASANRLKSDNLRESDETLIGELQGVLPTGRAFEFKPQKQENVIRGKVGLEIEDADVLNRNFLHKLISVHFHVIQVGQGRPRYTIQQLTDIKLGGMIGSE